MKYFFMQIFLFMAVIGFSQNAVIKGNVVDTEGNALSGVAVQLQPVGLETFTNSDGFFLFDELSSGEYVVIYGDETANKVVVNLSDGETRILNALVKNVVTDTVTDLEENIFDNLDVLETADETSSVSSLLSASRDVFLNKAGYQFGSDVFFRVRGYDSQFSDFMINGARFENPETGWQPFSVVGGLNDVLRYRDIETIGANKMENGFGEIGGARDYQLRPSNYSYGGRLTYSNLNRSYNNRVMGTFHSGENPSGWSYVVSGSKRWAQEGYVEGTYYDAYAGFAAVEKKVTDNYSVALTGFAAPRRRATQSIHTQEAYDIVGDNYYNADWGWQDGQKRNARLRKNFNPVVQLTNYLKLGEKTDLQVTGSYLFGDYIATRIERQNAANPDPDYYQNMPSWSGVGAPFSTQPSSRQLDWIDFYRQNLANGGESLYILEENKRDDSDLQVVAQANTRLSNDVQLDYGVNFRHYNGRFYKEVGDLLGGQYWRNSDSFNGNLNHFTDEIGTNNDVKAVGDVFGEDYDLNNRSVDAYLQAQFEFDKVDLFVAGNIGNAQYWRYGNEQMAKFPNNSLGKGEVKNFLTYGGKAGATYKLDGRNYFSANGMYYVKPPLLSTAWLTPTTRDTFNDHANEQTVYGGEVNYNHNSPKMKLRATGYATRFENQSEAFLTFIQSSSATGFGRSMTNGIDRLHTGGELGFNYNVSADFSVSGAAAVGKYKMMSRPTFAIAADNGDEIFPRATSFLLDFYEDNTPQTALNLGFTYRAPKRFIFNIDGNYYDNSFAGPSAFLRTAQIASELAPIDGMTEEESLRSWTKQQRLPEAYRLNFGMYKAIRFSYEKQLGINLMVNNLLNDQTYPTLAFEQTRTGLNSNGNVDPNIFPTRYRYSTGRTYFLNIAYKFR